MDIHIPRMPHYERLLIVPISKAFEYYRDIEAYTERYPDYCKQVDIIEKSDNGNMIKTKEFWNTSIDNDVDHVVLYVNYNLIPLTEIRYEIVDSSYKKLIGIKNHILLEERENNQTGIEANNVLLDVECFPPHTRESDKYEEMIEYFTIKDCIHLENKPMEPFKEGQLCTKCFRGRLQTPRTKESSQRNGYKRKITFWECDRCNFQYEGTYIQAGNGTNISDRYSG
jgi:hypothetical protein